MSKVTSIEFANLMRETISEGTVLLKNDDALPLKQDDVVSIFGRCQINFYKSGTGSGGSVNVEYTTNLLDSLEASEFAKINEKLADIYRNWVKENPYDNAGGGWAMEPDSQKEMILSDEIIEDARSVSNKAIIVIGRTAGEDKDNRLEAGSLKLTDDELQMMEKVSKYFEKTIVILNTANIIDMSWLYTLENPPAAVMYAWQGGMEGGNGIADVLCGKMSPSGKLTDTIALSFEDYPSTRLYGRKDFCVYEEDIYVGYRYFETFCPEKVAFEFGYGLTYSKFHISFEPVKIIYEQNLSDSKKNNIQFLVTGFVKNTGDFPCKEVVQIYMQPPQGKLGKPSKVLCGFYKTPVLNSDETCMFEIKFDQTRLASYDDTGITGCKSAFVLEEGDYVFFGGNSVRNVNRLDVECRNEIKDSFHVEKCTVVEQLEEALAPSSSFNVLKPLEQKEDGTYEQCFVPAHKRSYELETRIKSNIPKLIPRTGNININLHDVTFTEQDGKPSLDDFIGQLSIEELACLTRGEGMCNPRVTHGTASAFGGLSDNLCSMGIPAGCTSDGPSGIRMDSGEKATQVPIGTMLACTWNPEIVEKLFTFEGKEINGYNIDVLLGPGMNIHRNPINGRNFEYFSEDPLLTGIMAGSVSKGLANEGVFATLKHFCCNNQETGRLVSDSVVSERALREIYLKGFEIAIKEFGAKSVMTSYNKINGFWGASNYDLTTTILRKQWHFDGMVMSDWWSSINDVMTGGDACLKNMENMVRAQNDVYMCVPNNGAFFNVNKDTVAESVENGKLYVSELQRAARNICKFLMSTKAFERNQEYSEPVFDILPFDEYSNEYKVKEFSDKSCMKVAAGKECFFKIEEDGEFRLVARIMSTMPISAQSVTNIFINETKVGTVQTNGTQGAWATIVVSRIILKQGIYRISAEDVKPGIVIDFIEVRE